MLRVRQTCKVTSGADQYLYSDGLLHSKHDEPAIVFRVQPKAGQYIQGVYLAAINFRQDYTDPYYHITEAVADPDPSSSVFFQREYDESRWYDRGGLHRNFGPAVCSKHYWYKYHRGKQASVSNEFDEKKSNTQKCLRKRCGGCTKTVASMSIQYVAARIVPARVCHTCFGTIIECEHVPGAGRWHDYYELPAAWIEAGPRLIHGKTATYELIKIQAEQASSFLPVHSVRPAGILDAYSVRPVCLMHTRCGRSVYSMRTRCDRPAYSVRTRCDRPTYSMCARCDRSACPMRARCVPDAGPMRARCVLDACSVRT